MSMWNLSNNAEQGQINDLQRLSSQLNTVSLTSQYAPDIT